MTSAQWRYLYWTSNKESLFGFEPGKLVIIDYQIGGGFAGAPEVLTLGLTEGIAPDRSPEPRQEEWPMPSNSVEYRIGGHQFSGYHIFDTRQTKDINRT